MHEVLVFFTYKAEEEPKVLKLKKKTIHINLSQCYNKNLCIGKEKQINLIKLCNDGIIPQKFHDEYLQMTLNITVEDNLPETDDEEEYEMESD